MRLLISCYFTHAAGGTETYLRTVIPLLRARGIQVGVLTRTQPSLGPDSLIPEGLPLLLGEGQSPGDLVRTAAEWNPSVVYTHGLGEPEFEAALAERFPTVYYAHSYGGTCVSGTKAHAFPGVRPCNRTLGPGCLALYLPRRCGGLNPLTAIEMYRRERRRQKTFCQFRAVLAASRHMANELARNGAPADRIRLVPLPTAGTLDANPPAPRARSGRIMFVGRLVVLKGWSHLIDAISRAAGELDQPLTLVVAGDGPDRKKFESAVRRAGLQAEFLGWIGTDQRDAEMRAADVIAVPSIWPEPFGLIGIEAGGVGLPAVGYMVGGVTDWLTPGVSGEGAPGERPDPRELAAALVRAVGDADHWQRLRVGAWETARRFSPEAHLDRLLPVLEAAAQS